MATNWNISLESLLILFQTLFGAYSSALHAHPLLVKMMTSTFLSFSGDFFAQNLEHFYYGHHEEQEIDKEKVKERKPWKWNKRRTLSMAAFGSIWGFTAHYWYHYLDLLGLHVYPDNLDRQIIFKLVIDMFIFEPFAVGLYFVGVGTLEGQKFDQICCKLSTSFFPLVAMDFLIWPIFTFFVFHTIPVNWQTITFAMMDFFYDLFLSLINHSDIFRKLKTYLAIPCKNHNNNNSIIYSSSSDTIYKEEILLQSITMNNKETLELTPRSSVTIEIQEVLEL